MARCNQWKRWASAVVALCSTAACGGSENKATVEHSITGTMDLVATDLITYYANEINSADGAFASVNCSEGLPDSGYSDIRSGAQVVVTNESGTTISTSKLDEGRLSLKAGDYLRCRFPFTVAVPTARFYAVSVSGRGDLTFSFDEMVANGWRVEFSVGDA